MNGNRIRLSVTTSTNLYTTELLGQSGIDEFTLVTAEFQEQGRGQRGNSWQSDSKANMLSSLVFFPKVKISDQFLVSASASLVLLEVLQEHGVIGQLKWPNDIFVKGKKIGGMLIENQVKDGRVASSIIGVGLNVNQTEFETFNWEATSMALLKNQYIDLELVMASWQRLASERLRFWIQNKSGLIQAFNRKLYLRDKRVSFKRLGEVIEGEIVWVNEDGALQINVNGQIKSFVNGDIKLLNTSSQ